MHRLARTLALLAAAFLGVACNRATSEQPLTPEAEARRDARLEGLWRVVPPEGPEPSDPAIFVYLTPMKGATLRALVFGDGSDDFARELHRCEVFPSAVAGRTYLNARCPDLVEEEPGRKPGRYDLVRYQVRKNGTVKLWVMELGPVVEAIQSGALPGRLASGRHTEDAVVTAEPEKLAAWLAKADGSKLFRELAVLHPVPIPRVPPRTGK
jgi:hypothetical protein